MKSKIQGYADPALKTRVTKLSKRTSKAVPAPGELQLLQQEVTLRYNKAAAEKNQKDQEDYKVASCLLELLLKLEAADVSGMETEDDDDDESTLTDEQVQKIALAEQIQLERKRRDEEKLAEAERIFAEYQNRTEELKSAEKAKSTEEPKIAEQQKARDPNTTVPENVQGPSSGQQMGITNGQQQAAPVGPSVAADVSSGSAAGPSAAVNGQRFDLTFDRFDRMIPGSSHGRTRRQSTSSHVADSGVSQQQINFIVQAQLQAKANLRPEDIQPFTGKSLEWQAFAAAFEDEVLHNEAFPDSRKRTFLQRLCQDSAATKFAEFSRISTDVYDIYDNLRAEYENKHAIKRDIENLILAMPTVRDDADVLNLESLEAKLSEIIRTIRSLDQQFENYLLLYVADVANKLWLRQRKEVICTCDSLDDVLRSIKELVKRGRRWRLYCDNAPANQTPAPPAPKPRPVQHSWSPSMNQHRQVCTMEVDSKTDARKCVFCAQDHPSLNCNVPLTYQARRAAVLDNQLCKNCLSPEHFEKVCPLAGKIICGRCKELHPTPLHEVRFYTKTAPNPAWAGSSDTSVKTLEGSAITIVGRSTTDRPTMKGLANGIDTKILLDTGSEQTMISPDLVLPAQRYVADRVRIRTVDGEAPTATLEDYSIVQLSSFTGSSVEMRALLYPPLSSNTIVIGADYARSLMKKGEQPVIKTCWGDVPYGNPKRDVPLPDNVARIPVKVQCAIPDGLGI